MRVACPVPGCHGICPIGHDGMQLPWCTGHWLMVPLDIKRKWEGGVKQMRGAEAEGFKAIAEKENGPREFSITKTGGGDA